MTVSVSISGNYIPPFFVFPLKNYRDYFIARVPDGSAGFANKSGWMTRVNFVLYVERFIKHTNLQKINLCLFYWIIISHIVIKKFLILLRKMEW